jgi:hypothetical protein
MQQLVRILIITFDRTKTEIFQWLVSSLNPYVSVLKKAYVSVAKLLGFSGLCAIQTRERV